MAVALARRLSRTRRELSRKASLRRRARESGGGGRGGGVGAVDYPRTRRELSQRLRRGAGHGSRRRWPGRRGRRVDYRDSPRVKPKEFHSGAGQRYGVGGGGGMGNKAMDVLGGVNPGSGMAGVTGNAGGPGLGPVVNSPRGSSVRGGYGGIYHPRRTQGQRPLGGSTASTGSGGSGGYNGVNQNSGNAPVASKGDSEGGSPAGGITALISRGGTSSVNSNISESAKVTASPRPSPSRPSSDPRSTMADAQVAAAAGSLPRGMQRDPCQQFSDWQFSDRQIRRSLEADADLLPTPRGLCTPSEKILR